MVKLTVLQLDPYDEFSEDDEDRAFIDDRAADQLSAHDSDSDSQLIDEPYFVDHDDSGNDDDNDSDSSEDTTHVSGANTRRSGHRRPTVRAVRSARDRLSRRTQENVDNSNEADADETKEEDEEEEEPEQQRLSAEVKDEETITSAEEGSEGSDRSEESEDPDDPSASHKLKRPLEIGSDSEPEPTLSQREVRKRHLERLQRLRERKRNR